MSISFPRLFRRKQAFSRNAVRYACQIDCDLLLVDSEVSYHGRLIDISLGGAMFRPRLAYLLNRRDLPAQLKLGNLVIDAHVVNTTPAGFGLRFEQVLSEEMLQAIIGSEGKARAA